jgi:hypothetical protein
MHCSSYHDIFGPMELLNDVVERGAGSKLLAGFAFYLRVTRSFRKLALRHGYLGFLGILSTAN